MDFIKETLDWVNVVRAVHNIGDPLEDLPKGERGHACTCPIAQALLAAAVSRSYGVQHDWHGQRGSIDLPESAQQFIAAFDLGELPQYEETA